MSQTPIQSDALAALRVQIDALDQQLLNMLNQRALLAEKVGDIKRAEGSPFFRPDRVAQVIDKITTLNPGPLKNEHVASIWREVMSACRALEAPQRVAYLGPAGTFLYKDGTEVDSSANTGDAAYNGYWIPAGAVFSASWPGYTGGVSQDYYMRGLLQHVIVWETTQLTAAQIAFVWTLT